MLGMGLVKKSRHGIMEEGKNKVDLSVRKSSLSKKEGILRRN